MKASSWGWLPARTEGMWRHGPRWLRPFTVAAPWMTVMLLLLMFHILGGTVTVTEGVLFDLPETAAPAPEGDALSPKEELVALVLPTEKDNVVFFDDARYQLGDRRSAEAFAVHLRDRVDRAKEGARPLLFLVDRRIPSGELVRLAALAKAAKARSIRFATRSTSPMIE